MPLRDRSPSSVGPGAPPVLLVGFLVVCLASLAVAGPAVAAADEPTTDLQSIEPGETTVGAVDESDPTRDNPRGNDHTGTWYYEPVTFEGEAGDVVRVSAYAEVDTSLVLLDPNGTRVASNEDGGPGSNSELLAHLGSNGTYTLQVTSHYPATTFEYVLSVQPVENHTTDLESIDVGETRVGRVDQDDPRDERFGPHEAVTFDGRAGEEVTIDVNAWISSAVYLLDSEGDEVARAVETASGRDARLTATLPWTGTYTVVVAGGSGPAYFPYELGVHRASEAPPRVEIGHHGHHGGGGDATSKVGPDVVVVAVESNRSIAFVGDSVRTTVTVANLGDAQGSYEAALSTGNATTPVETTVAPYAVEHLGATTTFDDPGLYEPGVENDTVAVRVVDPAEAVGNGYPIDDAAVVGYVPNASAGDRIDVRVAPADPGPATFTALNATATDDGGFGFEARHVGDPPEGIPAPDAGDPTYLLVEDADGAPDGLDGRADDVTVTVRVADGYADSPAAVAVYEYDEAAGAWVRAPTELVDDGATRYRATVDDPSLLAVGTLTAPVTVTADLDQVDETGAVRVTVVNDGTAPVERTAALHLDDEPAVSETVTVSPGDETTLALPTGSLDPGTYALVVGGEEVGSLTVDAPATPTPATSTATEPSPTPTERSGPGFGPLAVVVAAAILALLAIRR